MDALKKLRHKKRSEKQERKMSHLSGRCTCGRKQHYPKGSKIGSTWKCWSCGKTWTISTEGRPLRDTRSKIPPNDTYSPDNSDTTETAGIPWWSWVIAVFFVFWIVGIIVDFITTHWVTIVSIIGSFVLLFIMWISRKQIRTGFVAIGRNLKSLGKQNSIRYSSWKSKKRKK